MGTVTPHVVAVRDRLAQSQGHSHHPVFALVAGHGIVVVRTREPRQGRVETPVVTGACDLLNDDRHFFGVVGEPARTTGDHRVFEKCRGPGELDRARETSITSIVVLLGIGYHLGGEDAREGALLRVFEITRRPDGEGRLQDPEERSKFCPHLFRQLTALELLRDLAVRNPAEHGVDKPIALHEFRKHVSRDDHRAGHIHRDTLELGSVETRQNLLADLLETHRLAAHATGADPRKTVFGTERP